MKDEKNKLEIILVFIKSLLWPLIFLFIYLMNFSSINLLIKSLPNVVQNSSKVSVGSISFEIQNRAELKGDYKLATLIPSLSQGALNVLLKLGTTKHDLLVHYGDTMLAMPEDLKYFVELEENNLLKTSYRDNSDGITIKKFLTSYSKLKLTNLDRQFIEPYDDFDFRNLSKAINRIDYNANEWSKFDSYGVALNEMGLSAYDIIIDVVSSNISKK